MATIAARAANTANTARHSSIPRWVDGIAIIAALVLMLRWTWFTWPDPLVDFGRELSVPWQITSGRLLYRDIAYLNGPFSPHFNAIWMELFGVSLSTIVVINLVILLGVLALVYVILNRIANRTTALIGALVFVPLSGCGRLLGIGNYNFLCPYSHDLTHGLALSLGALACLLLPKKLTVANTAASGALVGLVFLTKLETVLACSTAILVGFILRVAAKDRRSQLLLTAALMISALAPGILAFLVLSCWMPWKTSLIGVSSAIYWPLHSEVSSLPFYRNLLGTDDLKHNLLQMLIGAALIAAAGFATAGAGFLSRRVARVLNPQVAPMAFFCGGATLFAVSMWKSEHWFFSVPKALPIAVIWLLWIWIIRYRHERRGTDESAVLILRMAFSIFALVFLVKIFFNAALFHYGFALAMPATLLMFSLFVCWIPQYASARGADLRVGTAVGMSFVFVMLFNYLFAMSLVLANEQYRVGFGANSFVADDRAFGIQAALQLIETTMPRNATLAVVPEGAIINVISGRINPTRHNVLMPVELKLFGERRVAEDFQDHPPDFVLLCHKDTTEYGAPLFGRDYGRDLDVWLRQNYVEVGLIGNRPFQNPEQFGMLLMRHR